MTHEDQSVRWLRLDQDTEEFLKFERVLNKRSRRPDLHAFLLLDELFPSDSAIISGTSHDEIYIDIGIEEEQLATLTDAQILELIRCGMRCDGEGLQMFA